MRFRDVPGSMVVAALAAVSVAVWLLAGGPLPGSGEEADEPPGWPPPRDVIARGRLVYQSNCVTCHGANGEGEPNWKVQHPDGAYPAPPHDATGHTWHHSDGLLFEIVRDGGARFESPTFRSRMPAWGANLSDEEIRAVITYLKSLWGSRERAFQAEMSRDQPFPTQP